MDKTGFSKRKFLALTDVAARCAQIEDIGELRNVLDSIAEFIEFDFAILCLVESTENESLLKSFVNHSYPRSWIDCYTSNSYAHIDPVIKYADISERPFLWREALAKKQESQTTVTEAAKDHGLMEGISYAVNNGFDGKIKTLISLSGKEKLVKSGLQVSMALLTLLSPLFHDVNVKLHYRRKYGINDARLTGREREIIAWTADGKSIEEIGIILSISQDTVKFHMKNIYGKLNASNRYHAVSNALRTGVI